jgi:hypothetical protein
MSEKPIMKDSPFVCGPKKCLNWLSLCDKCARCYKIREDYYKPVLSEKERATP